MQQREIAKAFAGIAAAALLAGAVWAGAQQTDEATPPPGTWVHGGHVGHGGPGFGLMVPGLMPPHMVEHLASQLGLSTEQQQTIKGFHEQARPAFEQLHKQLHANAELLMNTRPDDPNYTKIVTNVSQSASELAAQFVLQASQLRSQVFGVLTAGQRTKLVQLQAQMKTHLQQRHDTWYGAAPPPGSPAMPE